MLEGPLNKEVGENVIFKLITPPSTHPTNIYWDYKGDGYKIPISAGDEINEDFIHRVTVNKSTVSLELRNLTLHDTGEYILSLKLGAEEGRASLAVFGKCSLLTQLTSRGLVLTNVLDGLDLTQRVGSTEGLHMCTGEIL